MRRVRHIQGSRVIVTGASSGIGAALGELMARRGAHVLLAARSGPALDDLASRLRTEGCRAEAVQVDLTIPDDRHRMITTASELLGGLDILVNNAGLNARGLFENSTEDTLRQLMELNFFALVETTRLALPLLRQGTRAIIVNISSASGRRGFPMRAEYTASKFAVSGFSEVLRAELATHGIDVLLVCPGHVRTNITERLVANTLPAGVTGKRHSRGWAPEKAAQRIVSAIERGKHELVFPFAIRIALLVNRLVPWLVDRLCARRSRKLADLSALHADPDRRV